jgi:hypothetical protein
MKNRFNRRTKQPNCRHRKAEVHFRKRCAFVILSFWESETYATSFFVKKKQKKKTTTFKPGPGLTQRIHKFYVAAKNLTVPESGEFFLCNFSLYAIAGLIFFYM